MKALRRVRGLSFHLRSLVAIASRSPGGHARRHDHSIISVPLSFTVIRLHFPLETSDRFLQQLILLSEFLVFIFHFLRNVLESDITFYLPLFVRVKTSL
jgi:hypothetical protein